MTRNLEVTSLSAVVLAAGRSTRMGREKALIEIDGMPMWQRQREVLARAGAMEIFLSARSDQTWANAATGFAAVINDSMPDCGPIMGITAAIERATQPHIAAIAIDLPQMRAEWFSMLLERCGAGVGAVGRREGFYEPLAAIFPKAMMWLAWETIARGEYSLQRLISAAVSAGFLQVLEIDAPQAAWFENRNGP